MTKLKRQLLKFFSKSITAFISLFGFMMCGLPKAEYGVPSADFILNGNVKSTTTTEVIPEIRVVMQGDTVQTDENGNFSVRVIDFPMEHTYKVSFKDIDGVENGSFTEKEVDFTFPDEFEGGDGKWYEGKNVQNLNVTLDDAVE